jgi:hypothetical protein
VLVEFAPHLIGFSKGRYESTSVQVALTGIEHGICGRHQPTDHVPDDAKIIAELAFRARFKKTAFAQIFAGHLRFDKKLRVIDHVFAHLAVGLLIVLEKDKKLSGGKRVFYQVFGQSPGMLGVGARHRCQYPCGCPA